MWDDSESTYRFGKSARTIKTLKSLKDTIVQQEFISTSKEDHNIKVVTKSGFLWDTNQEMAIEKGNLIHNIMSHINSKNDIDFVINDFLKQSTINLEQASKLKQLVLDIVEHPKLEKYYAENNAIYNERDIITKEGVVLRPDRVVLNYKNEAVIIDYKTGVENKKHEQQLQLYQDVLEEMSFSVSKKILVYINDDITVKDV